MRVSESIYLDYQASTPTDARVLEAMLPYFTDSFGNPHSSSHILGWRSADSVESARYEVASLVGALPEEIVFSLFSPEMLSVLLPHLSLFNTSLAFYRGFVPSL